MDAPRDLRSGGIVMRLSRIEVPMLRALPVLLGLALTSLANAAAAGEIIHACEDHQGRLRVPGEPGACEDDETPLAWQRHGGVRLFDADGADLGRVLPWHTFFRRFVWNDRADVAYLINGHTGALENFGFAQLTFFDEPGCQGRAIVDVGGTDQTPVGALIPDDRTPGALWVVSDRDPTGFPVVSRFLSGDCRPWQFPPLHAAALEPFQGELGLSFPVRAPLRLGSDLPADPDPSRALHVCIGPSGGLRRVSTPDACRPSERADAWLPLGGPRVFDADGRELGLLVAAEFVYHPGADVWFRLSPNEGSLRPLSRAIAFTGRDCTGQALVEDLELGRLFPSGDPSHPLFAARGPLHPQATTRSMRREDGICRNGTASLLENHVAAEPFVGDLGFAFPVTPPLVPGFPGSPIADPGGEAPGLGILHACVGPRGRLRAVDDPVSCRTAESPLSWERRGGLRVFDAAGTDLGTLATPSAPLDDATGLRFGFHFRTATFDDDPLSSSARDVFFEELECRGRGFVDRPWAGFVFERAALPPRFFVGTKRIVKGLFSRSIGRPGGCTTAVRAVPLGIEFEGLADELPFALPLAAPLRIGPALP